MPAENQIEKNIVTDLLALLNAGWRSTYSYRIGDITSYAGKYYVAILAGANHRPDTSTTYWTALFSGVAINQAGRQDEDSGNPPPRIRVWVEDLADAFGDGFMSSGVYTAQVTCQAATQDDDDNDGSQLAQLSQCLRDVLLWRDVTAGVTTGDAMLASLNELSTINTYFGTAVARSFREPVRDGLHLFTLQLALQLSPTVLS